ncbi:MAG TPA: methyltransferase domain-containing protein [Trueperaceae bacterium]
MAAQELKSCAARVLAAGDDSVVFSYGGAPEDLLELRIAVAVYRVIRFEVPRPKALLGHEHFGRLVAAVKEAVGERAFEGFRFGAAGSDSPVFARLAAALEEATGLERSEEGELLLRFRPTGGGWEVLVRLTPRPLSARSWRRCNLPGGLNATVAAAGLQLLGASGAERHLNLMCGSGTLLVERGLGGRWKRGVGLDVAPAALECARRNLEAAGLGERAELIVGDAATLPFADGSFDRLSADLPWGDAIGGHEENSRLYPAFLAESARVAARHARMLAITHELRLFERALSQQSEWRLAGEPLRVFHGGHRPGLYLLERLPAR